MLEGKFSWRMGNPAVETVVYLHTERRRLCPRSKRPNVPFSTLCPLRVGLLSLRMMMGFLLRRLVCLFLPGRSCERSIKKQRLHRSLACLLMTRARYARRVGVQDFCATSASVT